jgi:hypothetical protein
MINTYFKILFFAFLVLQPVSLANAGVAERNNFLTQLLSLAEKPKQYVILDAQAGKISLMIRGIVLREWKVDKLELSGEPIPLKPFPLINKSIQMVQLRHQVNIDDESEDNASDKTSIDKNADNKGSNGDKSKNKFALIALEVDSMPTDYQLFFDEGITINVRSKAEGYNATFKENIDRLKSYFFAVIHEVWPSNDEKKSTGIDVFFKDKTEAQALFWAFSEGTECLFLPQNSNGSEDFKLANVNSDSTDNRGNSPLKKSINTK